MTTPHLGICMHACPQAIFETVTAALGRRISQSASQPAVSVRNNAQQHVSGAAQLVTTAAAGCCHPCCRGAGCCAGCRPPCPAPGPCPCLCPCCGACLRCDSCAESCAPARRCSAVARGACTMQKPGKISPSGALPTPQQSVHAATGSTSEPSGKHACHGSSVKRSQWHLL